MTDSRAPRYPGYDVLDKRHTPSWDAQTRRVIDARLAVPREPRFLSTAEFETAQALCRRILPQPGGRPEVPLAALLDAKLMADHGDGFREGGMPYMQEAWRRGLAAIETESARRHAGRRFAVLHAAEQDALLGMMQRGELTDLVWDGLGAAAFFKGRILTDIPGLYYAHPTAWSEMGFGGPASPRGYVRLQPNLLDPLEAIEARPGEDRGPVRKENRRVG